MYIKNINLYNIFKNIFKIKYILIIVLFIIVIISAFKPKTNNKIEKQNINYFDGKTKVEISSYYSNAKVCIYSNKNTNEYMIEEWYMKNIAHMFKLKDSVGSSVKYVLKNNNLQVKNENQKNILEVLEYNNEELNILSFNTFVTLYNQNILSNENKVQITKSDKHIVVSIPYEQNIYTESIELIKNIIDNNIIQYKVKDKNGDDRIVIKYNKLEINKEFSKNIFK